MRRQRPRIRTTPGSYSPNAEFHDGHPTGRSVRYPDCYGSLLPHVSDDDDGKPNRSTSSRTRELRSSTFTIITPYRYPGGVAAMALRSVGRPALPAVAGLGLRRWPEDRRPVCRRQERVDPMPVGIEADRVRASLGLGGTHSLDSVDVEDLDEPRVADRHVEPPEGRVELDP
jgi:hypothetical protein